ncbi:unnamed protein product [Amoebophrya sp. A120]|nr:unnamed protein product [Amoebophrya sp. A120]|eukprot:GSA120T00011798001.1
MAPPASPTSSVPPLAVKMATAVMTNETELTASPFNSTTSTGAAQLGAAGHPKNQENFTASALDPNATAASASDDGSSIAEGLVESATTYLATLGTDALASTQDFFTVYLPLFFTVTLPKYFADAATNGYNSVIQFCIQLYYACCAVLQLLLTISDLVYQLLLGLWRVAQTIAHVWLTYIGILPIIIAATCLIIFLVLARSVANRRFARLRNRIEDVILSANVHAEEKDASPSFISSRSSTGGNRDLEQLRGALPLFPIVHPEGRLVGSSREIVAVGDAEYPSMRTRRLRGQDSRCADSSGTKTEILSKAPNVNLVQDDSSGTESANSSTSATPKSQTENFAEIVDSAGYPVKTDSRSLLFAGATSLSSVRANDSRSDVQEVAEINSKPCLLYVHAFRGSPGDAGYRVSAQMAKALSTDLATVRLRWHGFRGSDSLLHWASAADYVQDVMQALRRLVVVYGRRKITLVGHGLGATICFIVHRILSTSSTSGRKPGKRSADSTTTQQQDPIRAALQGAILLCPQVDYGAVTQEMLDPHIQELLAESPVFASGLGRSTGIDDPAVFYAGVAELRSANRRYHVKEFLYRSWLVGAGWQLLSLCKRWGLVAAPGLGGVPSAADSKSRKKKVSTQERAAFVQRVCDWCLHAFPAKPDAYEMSQLGGAPAMAVAAGASSSPTKRSKNTGSSSGTDAGSDASAPSPRTKNKKKRKHVEHVPFETKRTGFDIIGACLEKVLIKGLLTARDAHAVRHVQWTESQSWTSRHDSAALLAPLLLVRFARELLGQAPGGSRGGVEPAKQDASDDQTTRESSQAGGRLFILSSSSSVPEEEDAALWAGAGAAHDSVKHAEEKILLGHDVEKIVDLVKRHFSDSSARLSWAATASTKMSSFPRRTTGGVRRFAEDPSAMAPPGTRPITVENAFPVFSSAEGLPLDRVTVSNTVFEFWSYEQLEPLSAAVLARRVAALQEKLRDCGFVDQGAPRSRQTADLTRYLIVKQAFLACEANQVKATAREIAKMLRRFGCPEAFVIAETRTPTPGVSQSQQQLGELQVPQSPRSARSDSPDGHREHFTPTGAYGDRRDDMKYGHMEDTRMEDGLARVVGHGKRHVEVPDHIRPKARSVDVQEERTGRLSQALGHDDDGAAGYPKLRDPSPRNKRADPVLRNASHFNGCVLDPGRPEDLMRSRMNSQYADAPEKVFGARLTNSEQRKRYHAPRPSDYVVFPAGEPLSGDVITEQCHRTGEVRTWKAPYDDRVAGTTKKRVQMDDHAHCLGVFETDGIKNEAIPGTGHGRKYIDRVLGPQLKTERGHLASFRPHRG